MLNLRVMGGNRSGAGKTKTFDPCEVDYVFAVTDDGDRYVIPSATITAKHSICLGDKWKPFKV